MTAFNRRNFLKTSGTTLLPAIIPFSSVLAFEKMDDQSADPTPLPVKFFGDGEMYEPADYINELQKANAATKIVADRYGAGGVVEALEKKFAELTGKEKAIFMPSGTMANQLAISVLSGEISKVFVQDTSHVYRDEADSAQSVFNKRLMPLAMGETYFTADELQKAVEALKPNEAFKTGVGAVSIENPVRRTDGRTVPIEEIRKISAYCRANNIKMHLDGARLFMASAWTGVSIKEYASNFDTTYISLYKYLGASGGAMLCGPAAVIDKMTHLIKVHGGTMFGNWANAAMALYKLEGFENRLKEAIERSKVIFGALTKLGFKIAPLDGGSNIYTMEIPKGASGKKLQDTLNKQYRIWIPLTDAPNQTKINVNDTLLYRNTDYIIDAFKAGL